LSLRVKMKNTMCLYEKPPRLGLEEVLLGLVLCGPELTRQPFHWSYAVSAELRCLCSLSFFSAADPKQHCGNE